ncbi:DUF4302 domain-containing protein [Pontibacter silvestris]|uniref:DUF4302 domain-containing protein n=1 Tax=Pontibacter silvestris TaxID=2305183 RepID=A0ABW4WUB0_9BACT|nr:DUF4302 domain-containing protein [Pontibacter silvestris]MCC9137684.1 DUF4302 domain-containing protein [Pontibacter silvestris]
MRKILLLGLLILSFLSACKDEEEELIQGQRPDKRLNETLTAYKAQLTSAEYGWKALLLPAGGAGYNFLFSFGEDDRVSMYSDINASTAANAMSSTYRLKGMQRPSLLFDTYSYIHILSDPDATISGGDWGQGQYSDFEFTIESATADSISLEGIYNGSKLILTRATQEDAANFIDRIAANANALENINSFTTYFKRVSVGDKSFDVDVNTDIRLITFSYYEGNIIQTFTTRYYLTEDGLVLLEPFVHESETITSLNSLTYNTAEQRIDLVINGVSGSIQESTKPAIVDAQAPRRFYNGATYWVSTNGFTKEGVTDAFMVRSIQNFDVITLYIQVKGLLFWTIDGNYFGPTFNAELTNDGRIIFTETGEFRPTPEEAAPMVTATSNQLFIPEGYYVIQTGTNSYDLVSAKDAKAWISFQ